MMWTDEICLASDHHRLAGVRSGLAADVLRYLDKSPENRAAGGGFKHRLGALLTPGLLALVAYRAAHFLHVNGWWRTARFLSGLNLLVHKVRIPPQTCIGPGCLLPHPAGVTFIGTAGRGLTLYSLAVCCPREPLDEDVTAGPRLGDRVVVGGHAVILGPVRVGDDTKVAFTVTLGRDAPPRSLVVSTVLRPTLRRPLDDEAVPATSNPEPPPGGARPPPGGAVRGAVRPSRDRPIGGS